MTRDYVEYLKIPFEYKNSDCFTLIKVFYKQEFGIEIGDWEYPEHWFEGVNLILAHYKEEGFTRHRTPSFEYGNVILFTESGFAKHLGVCLEDGFFLHTTRSGTAIHSYVQGYWSTKIVATFKHKRVRP